MDTAEIRRRFLTHFEDAGHTIVPSASLLFDDPNLLFVNAGMVPFKPYFLGQETPPYDRATSVQKCVRTLDIEEVGKTTRHGTFFQMSGNFSFGDYFKEGAIELAWELVTKSQADGGFGFDESQLYASVYHDDEEAIELWRKVAKLPDDRIVRLGAKDNYWHMGVPGPGGPCSEILIDRGPEFGAERDWEAGDRYMEFWNLVFMQYELSDVRSKEDFDIAGDLPAQNIDTGMGLERVAYLLQGKDNIYEIDEIFPVIEKTAELTGKKYGANEADDVRFRVVADHVRSALMLIGDGVSPGNESRGYIVRRLLRRAVRSVRLLGFDEPALPYLMPVTKDKMKASYPELEAGFERIAQIAYGEEEAFRQTLVHGTQIFDLAASTAKKAGASALTGDEAFKLHDTYGFPIDLTLEMAGEQGLDVDEAGFRSLMTAQRERAKADARSKKGQHANTLVYREALDTFGPTDWRALDSVREDARVQRLVSGDGAKLEVGAGELVEVMLNRSPFYAESGGQSADTGELAWDGGRAEVLDVQRPLNGLVVHQVRVLEGSLRPDIDVDAHVDEEWRRGATQAHSATHVIGAALRESLGPTATQSGSFNRPGFLRLDFGWGSALSPEQIQVVEQKANAVIRQDFPVETAFMPKAQAVDLGAQALFGERYPDIVRVVEIGGPWSRELCGGTHVSSTSEIGTMVLTHEGSVSAGNRRVEMVTGFEGFQYLARERDLVRQLSDLLKAPSNDLPGRVSDLVDRLRASEKEIERIKVQQLLAGAHDLAAQAQDLGGVAFVGRQVDGASGGDVRTLALDVRGRFGSDRPAVVALIGTGGGKPSAVAAVNQAAQDRGLSAHTLIQHMGQHIGGRGGGKADVAQGGGTDVSGIDAALAAAAANVGGA